MILTSHRESLIYTQRMLNQPNLIEKKKNANKSLMISMHADVRLIKLSYKYKVAEHEDGHFRMQKFSFIELSIWKKKISRQVQFRFDDKFRKMNTSCQSFHVSHTKERCDQFFSMTTSVLKFSPIFYFTVMMHVSVCVTIHLRFHMLNLRVHFTTMFDPIVLNTHTKKI
jgi:hypothetical protein